MASKELIEQVEDILEAAFVQEDNFTVTANAILATILAEQIKHIEAEVDGYIENFRTMHRINGVHVTRALATLKRRLIDESPLGEQSE